MADRGMVGILDVDLGESSIPRMMNVEGKDVSQQCFFGWVPVYTHKDQIDDLRKMVGILDIDFHGSMLFWLCATLHREGSNDLLLCEQVPCKTSRVDAVV
ncbi:hypothetical protein ACROYT_G020938 [Oculina patagonica]